MPRFPARFLLAALIAALTVDLFFWKQPFGINFPLWVLIILIGLVVLLISEKARPAWINLALVLPILGLAASAFTRRESMTLFITTALALLGLLLLAATTRNGNWVVFRMWDHLKALVLAWWDGITRGPDLFRSAPPTEGDAPVKQPSALKRTWRAVRPVLIGLVLAMPLVTILAALLASADPIFSDQLTGLLKIFDLKRLPEYIFRFIYVIMLAYLFSGIYLGAVLPDRNMARPDPQQPWMKPFLGHIEGNIVLLCVDLLFAFFVALQFRYFFGGASNINVTGYTFSEYAVRGFNELVTVAVISLLTYLGLATIAKRESPAQRNTFSLLAVLLLALVMVILLSAWYRLGLYEQAYGFTRLRTYTHIFIPWLGVLLAAAILLEVFKRRGHFALALLVVIVGFGLTFPILNVDEFIAHKNLDRAARGLELDGEYLKELTNDAVPALLSAYNDPSASQLIKDTLGPDLACRSSRIAAEDQQPWQGYNLSDARAARLLNASAASLNQFTVRYNEKGYPIWEVMVNNQWQNCDRQYDDYID